MASEFTAAHPRTLNIQVFIDKNPAYKGSVHDEAGARAAGFKAAIVPGAVIYSHVSRLAIRLWGEAWIAGGSMNVRFLRPAFDGDHLTLSMSSPEGDPSLVNVTVRNVDGDELAVAWVRSTDETFTARPHHDHPRRPMPERPYKTEAGGLIAGSHIGTFERELTAIEYKSSRRQLMEIDPIYTDGGPVHPTLLMRMAMAEINTNFQFPSSLILTEAEGQNFSPVRPGQLVMFPGIIKQVFQRRGRYYFESEQDVYADGDAVAHIRMVCIYASLGAGQAAAEVSSS